MKLKEFIKNSQSPKTALFLGRFTPPTKKHEKIIQDASKNYSKVLVIIISGSESGKTKRNFLSPLDKKSYMYSITKKFNNVSIVESNSAYIPDILKKLKIPYRNVELIAGSDRVESYQKMLQGTGIKTTEIFRTNEDISASKIRQSLIDNDFETFCSLISSALKSRNNFVSLRKKILKLSRIPETAKQNKQTIREYKSSSLSNFLNEMGGRVFVDTKKTSPIKKEYIYPTLNQFVKEYKRVFPNINLNPKLVGSSGKKEISGDIDLGLDKKIFMSNGNPKIKEWGLPKDIFDVKYSLFKKAARTATDDSIKLKTMLTLISEKVNKESSKILTDKKAVGQGQLYHNFPIYDVNNKATNEFVQIDFMIGAPQWIQFSYYSDNYKGAVKGLHRTQLLVAMFDEKGYSFHHGKGVIKKDTRKLEAETPEEALNLLNKLYKINLTQKLASDFFVLHKSLKATPDYEKVLDKYLKILDSTRCDVPEDMQKYWMENQKRLGLKGKFLPDNSQLKKYAIQESIITESGATGGDRIYKRDIPRVFNEFVNKVLKPYVQSKGEQWIKNARLSGSGKRETEGTSGDVDIIFYSPSDDKAREKTQFAAFVSSMPDSIIKKFKSEKYQGKKFLKAGELVTVLFPYDDNKDVQVDVIFAQTHSEAEFKEKFLDMPAEKQGLLLGWIKSAMLELPHNKIEEFFNKLNVVRKPLDEEQEYEFNLSSSGVQIRLVNLIKDSQGKLHSGDRKVIGFTNKWDDFLFLVPFDLGGNYESLLNQIKKYIKNPRSKSRILGTFKSMVSVKSGEVGTKKGEQKNKALQSVALELRLKK